MDFQVEFNRHVHAAIAHTDDADKQKKLRDLLEGADASDDAAREGGEEPDTVPGDESGGGGTTNPTQPGKPG